MKKDGHQQLISIEAIVKAQIRLKDAVSHTPLLPNLNLSEKYKANVLLKREDLQLVRSYKIRGALNKISSLSAQELQNGVICASAGNHAQGVAFACQKLKIHGTIYMPSPTPSQKVKQVKMFGKEFVKIILTGDTFDDAYLEAVKYGEENKLAFIHPFDDEKVIEGQGTVGLEILEEAKVDIDYLFVPIGGGGLISGVGSYFKQISPETKIIGVEPSGAPAMKESLAKGKVVNLEKIDKFIDGAAVKKVGEKPFQICREVVDDIVLIPEGKVCSTILSLYNEDAIVVEPAGALSITALDDFKEEIKGKNVVCIVSGSNNDITRMEEIKERSLLFEGLKHYFIISFPQRAGALKEFVVDILGPTDDISHFEYTKKVNREKGPALVGIEVKNQEDYKSLIQRMKMKGINYELINEKANLFNFLV
ncbi:threonine ammonia-lyase [Flexithrix dorotheae]|uniref:threonine ammonia-lyase n=1 Tax=Flexithrix dorotheae TaxID=70993 RepID=UPI00035CA391|nr:threonine ammonia-lyase [Flexithrix dorotheae]